MTVVMRAVANTTKAVKAMRAAVIAADIPSLCSWRIKE